MTEDNLQAAEPAQRNRGWLRAIFMRLVVPVAVIGCGVGSAAWLIATKPKPKRRKLPKFATLVEVEPARVCSERVVVTVMGTVIPAQRIALKPQVSGRVVAINPNLMPGGRFKTGDMLVQIDRRDYEFALAQREADVARAELNHKVELGRQAIAKREWELHQQKGKASALDLELALRKPYLMQVEAALEAAKAARDRAALDLERTTLYAPFNAIAITKDVDIGSELSPQTKVATLAGTDEFWVVVFVPVDKLKWLRIPCCNGERCSVAHIKLNAEPGLARTGYVARLLGDLETQGRMAKLLVVVQDPLGLKNKGVKPLLLGSYVRVEIDGKQVDGVAPLARALVRGGDRVWVMNSEGKLEIREIETAFRCRDRVFVSKGIEDGDLLVKTDLPAPVEGMALRTRTAAPKQSTAHAAVSEHNAPEVAQ